jgi:hypothetical protein
MNNNTFGSKNWSTVRMMIMNGHKDTSTEIEVVNLLKASVANITKDAGTFIMNQDDSLSIIKESVFFTTCRNTRVKSMCTDRVTVTLYDILSKNIHLLTYDDIFYHPSVENTPYLNLFTGYKAKLTEEKHDISFLLNHIRDLVCNSNLEKYNYLLYWLAFVLQKKEKIGTAILMTGKGDLSKSVFWNWFSESIVGRKNTYMCTTPSSITKDFNSHITNKRLLIVGEVRSITDLSHDRLVGIMKEPVLSIEKKFLEAYQYGSVHCVVVMSTYIQHKLLGDSNKRFIEIECNSDIEDHDYYKKISDIMNVSSDQFYTHLMNMDISSFNPLQSSCKIDSNNHDDPHHVQSFLSTYKWFDWMKGSVTYDDYTKWCVERDYKPVHNSKFKNSSGSMLEAKKSKTGILYRLY